MQLAARRSWLGALQVVGAFALIGCRVERWPVKTGADVDASLVKLASTTPTSIASMVTKAAPSDLPGNKRIQPAETTVFGLDATLVEYKRALDSDYHLVISDGEGHTMIAEIPDPARVDSSSRFLSLIRQSRQTFDSRFKPDSSFKAANIPVHITGVGFFDFKHGQRGVAPNGIEIHPVLSIQFNDSH